MDLVAAGAALIGLKPAGRKSRAFPYGLCKAENLVAAALALLVFLTAYEILRHAPRAAPAPVQVDAWMPGLLLATGVVPLVFSRYELRAGRAANSPALIADAQEYRVHVYTTGLALAALLSEEMRFPIDRIAAIAIVVVVRMGWTLLRDAMRVLLDAALDAGTLAAIRGVIERDSAVGEPKWITARNAGCCRFVEAGVALRVTDLGKAQSVTERIERDVRAQVPHVERVLLHVEPPATPLIRYAVPLADRDGTVSAHFGEAPYFALVTVRRADGAVVSREDLSGKGPACVLRDAGIALVRSDAATFEQALADCNAPRRRLAAVEPA